MKKAKRLEYLDQLEKISNNQLNVFNFGRGYYYSQQENDLLYDLIKKGAPIPKYAITTKNKTPIIIFLILSLFI